MRDNQLHREDFETFYKVSHEDNGGFGGNSTKWVAVTEETKTEIIGHTFSPMDELPRNKVVIRKENVAGWEERKWELDKIPSEGEVPSMWVSRIKQMYMDGQIDEDRMEVLLENSRDVERSEMTEGDSSENDTSVVKSKVVMAMYTVIAIATVIMLEIIQAPAYFGGAVLFIEFVVTAFIIRLVCSKSNNQKF